MSMMIIMMGDVDVYVNGDENSSVIYSMHTQCHRRCPHFVVRVCAVLCCIHSQCVCACAWRRLMKWDDYEHMHSHFEIGKVSQSWISFGIGFYLFFSTFRFFSSLIRLLVSITYSRIAQATVSTIVCNLNDATSMVVHHQSLWCRFARMKCCQLLGADPYRTPNKLK